LLAEAQKQIRVLVDGAVDVISEKELEEALARSLKEKKPLRVKYGADPSAPDLHLGHTVALRKLKQFQDFGHTIVFIIGDFTARIGDPSQRSETRRMLSRVEVNRNAITYQAQVFKILDSRRTEVRYNSEWLNRMKPEDLFELMAQYTVARILERDDFQKRFRANQPITVLEFLYPLLQGHDSVVVAADIELGGTDQKFNLLVGRELQRLAGARPQVVMTLPLLEGTDGVQKMSKSYNNYIALEDSPKEMFGKIMSIPDALMERYYRYVSGAGAEETARIAADLASGKLHPREAKALLAEKIIVLYHGDARKAAAAREEFDKVFRNKGVPDEVQTVRLARKAMDLATLLKEAGLVASKSEGRRMVEQGAVKLDRERATDADSEIDLTRGVLVQCGKRKFARVEYHGK
jgi:tyrosyl-tRNA synthetase